MPVALKKLCRTAWEFSEGMNTIELVDKMKAIQNGTLPFDKEKLKAGR
jgi:hypothetical protein